MKVMTQRKNKGKTFAVFEIIVLVIAIFAFAYLIGAEFEEVGAQGGICVRQGNSGNTNVVELPAGTTFEQYRDENEDRYTTLEQTRCPSESPSRDLSIITNPTGQAIAGAAANRALNRIIPKEGEDVREVVGDTATDAAEEAAERGGGKEGTSLLGKIFGEGGLLHDFFNPSSITDGVIYGASAIGAAFILAGVVTFLKTGDFRQAKEVALRAGISAGGGYLAGVGTAALVGGPAAIAFAVGVAVGFILNAVLKDSTDRQIEFQCKPWQAQSGVDRETCSLCNDRDFPCTEYQCKTFGANCELINKETDDPRCVLKDPGELSGPFIEPWTNVLEERYSYEPLPAVRGVEVKYQGEECLPAFQPFSLGIELFDKEGPDKMPKEGYCRIDFERTQNFSAMQYDFGDRNTYHIQHEQEFTFPGVANLEQAGIELENGGNYEFYVRCESVNGVSDLEEFLFKFCIDEGPDTTPPIIRGFNWNNDAPVAYFSENQSREVYVEAYVNEPGQCKWDHEDKSYENMENSLSCEDNVLNMNSQLSYTCAGKLTGLVNREENNFFFRCNDTFGNVNRQSRELALKGTQPLHISSVSPNATTIKDSTDSVKVKFEVETNAGFNEGVASCSYSNTGEGNSYVKFSNTDSQKHSTNLWLTPGNYNYFIRCNDEANNADQAKISFKVETDTRAPVIARAYHEENFLKIITDENASCVYGNFNCEYLFKDGIKMTTRDDIEHFTDWNSNRNLYIKCEDKFGNQPLPNQCSMIVRPFEF